jgi:hypothetical protein
LGNPRLVINHYHSSLLRGARIIFIFQLIHDSLGYPVYFIQFTSFAKLLGAIIILVPGKGRIKDWAYAGLFFDLAAAIYSGIAVSGKFDPLMLTMLVWIVPGIVSYYCWRKKIKR